MPVVLTDRSNRVWCAEDPFNNKLLVGLTGKGGVAVQDLLEFVEKRQKQFQSFLEKNNKVKPQANVLVRS